MSLSDRDRKILVILVPVLVLAAFWLLLLSPKRDEAAKAGEELTAQEQRRDQAQAQLQQAQLAETDFNADYSEIVRLGKAIPAQVDMPSLLVQLEGAAKGTGIHFTKITAGERQVAAVPAPAAPTAGGDAAPVQAGGDAAQSVPGTAVESANDTAAQSNEAAAQSGVEPGDTQTSTTAGDGGLPVGGGAAGASATTAAPPVGLETVPLTLEFTGVFFNLADFFHAVKRFVHARAGGLQANGRLVTIEGVRLTSDPELFPNVRAELGATIYLSPLSEGATAGATPQGPAPTTPASDPASDPASAPAGTPAPPTAVVTP